MSIRPERLLFVDDDPRILSSFRRSLGLDYNVEVALGGPDGLRAVTERGPYAVVVADMRMPEMDGVALLSQVAAKSPDTIRIMLTGNVDQSTAVEAVNTGHVFRFLTKPTEDTVLRSAIEDALRLFAVSTARKDLLERTLAGSLRVLTDLLAMTEPVAFGKSQRIRDMAKFVAKELGLPDAWHIEVAAMLAPIGSLSVPPAVTVKFRHGKPLTHAEQTLIDSIPKAGSDILRKIPYLESVAHVVACQNLRFDGAGSYDDVPRGNAIPVGARIYRILHDLLVLEDDGMPRSTAFQTLIGRRGIYDFDLLVQMELVLPSAEPGHGIPDLVSVSVRCLKAGHILAADLRLPNGEVLLPSGSVLTDLEIQRIHNCGHMAEMHEPIRIHPVSYR